MLRQSTLFPHAGGSKRQTPPFLERQHCDFCATDKQDDASPTRPPAGADHHQRSTGFRPARRAHSGKYYDRTNRRKDAQSRTVNADPLRHHWTVLRKAEPLPLRKCEKLLLLRGERRYQVWVGRSAGAHGTNRAYWTARTHWPGWSHWSYGRNGSERRYWCNRPHRTYWPHPNLQERSSQYGYAIVVCPMRPFHKSDRLLLQVLSD